jgi:hypothetical protein
LENQVSARHGLLAALLLAAILAGRLLGPSSGLDWNDDYAQYVAHARSLVEHGTYRDTGYIYNPEFPQMGPPFYPPGFPVLLAPVVAAFGVDFRVMRGFIALLLVAAIAIFFAIWRGELPFYQRLLWLAAIGFSPVWIEQAGPVRSDIPFLFWTGLALLAIFRAQTREAAPDWRQTVLAGLLMYAAVATRAIGLVFLPSLALAELLRRRRITVFAVVPAAIAAGLFVGQSLLLRAPHGGGYADQLHGLAAGVVNNLREYPPYLKSFLFAGYPHWAGQGLTAAALLVALVGFAAQARKRLTILEVFTAGYLAAVFLWPTYQGLRLLLPLFPLWLFYLFVGLDRLAARSRRFGPAPAAAALAVAVAIGYAIVFAGTAGRTFDDGFDAADTHAMFAWVRAHAAPRDAVVFYRARALALFTRRPALSLKRSNDENGLRRFFCANRVAFAIDGRGVWPDDDGVHAAALTQLIARRPDWFAPAADVGRYHIYRWTGCAGNPGI